ncbi:MAG TPA: AraC family transcriptional regulator [Pseudolabrys sp.]
MALPTREIETIGSSPIGSLVYKSIREQSSALSNIVDAVADWDVPDGDIARDLCIKVLPNIYPYVIVQYRIPVASTWEFGGVSNPHVRYRHLATKVQTGVVTIRPSDAIGMVIVRLVPESAAYILGERMQCFANTKISLSDLFGATDVSLLEERVREAPNSAERVASVLRFLGTKKSQREPDLLVCRAAALLRRCPGLRVRQLASTLDISERHLSRRFQTMFGTSPKQFARMARIEKALMSRGRGSTWADIACSCGFADQAHLINDFSAIVGAPPEHVLGSPLIGRGERNAVSADSHNFFAW